MSITQLENKKIAVFGKETATLRFVNFFIKNNIKIVILDEKLDFELEENDLITFSSREELNWKEIECLITNQDDVSLIELSKKNDCPVLSIIEFFIKYFPEYNYIGLIGESGSLITCDLLKYLFCKLKLNIDYDICNKDTLFTLYDLGKTDNYIFQLNQERFTALKSPYFNNLIIFDLEYNKVDIDKIKLMLINQKEEDFAILNIDNKEVKELYNTIKDDDNYKSQLIPISIFKILRDGVSFVNNEIYYNIQDKNNEFLTNEFKNLTGEQNKINILSVFVLMSLRGYQAEEIIENLYNFKTCDEIFELVLHEENFVFINDIKNKNKSQSLISFDNIYWILCIDEIDFEFENFLELKEYFSKIKYVFLLGKYDDEILKLFRDNEVNYFIMYDMKNIFEKIKILTDEESKEEKITILLSSINDIEDNEFYEECGEEFEKLVNKNNIKNE